MGRNTTSSSGQGHWLHNGELSPLEIHMKRFFMVPCCLSHMNGLYLLSLLCHNNTNALGQNEWPIFTEFTLSYIW